jgi:hypothetical protein
MANIVQLKRSSVTGKVPDAGNVEIGEPVVNLADRVIFSKNTTGSVIVIGAGTTSNITEGSNLYFTNARAIASLTEGAGINIDANGLITASINENSFNSVGGNIIPSEDSVYNLGTANLRWGTLFLANNTINLGGSLISSDGTGTITISSSGAVLPINSKITVDGSDKQIALVGNTGAVTTVVPFFTKELGLNITATNFTFGANPDDFVFTNFTFSNGSAIIQSSRALFYF